MIQGLQMLCGVVLLAVITVGETWGAEAIEIRLQSGSPLEERARIQLRRLLRTHDLHKWLFTREVPDSVWRDPAQSSGAHPQYALCRR